nr:retrovirus-related Pol polyprotein from transposon TNT 1-94 [Tanacetum cinerariifolium]
MSANKKLEFVKSDDKKEDKKPDEKKREMSKVKCYNCKKEGHFAKDCKKAKVKDYNYYKKKMLLAKKDSDEQVLLAEDQAWMESSSDSDKEINANMVFMAQIKKVLSELDESSSSAKETIAEVSYYTSESESEFEFETSEYYDNFTNYGLFVNNDDDQEIFHDAIESTSKKLIENHIDSQKDYDKSKVDHNNFKEKEHFVDIYFEKAKDLRPSLYDEKVIGLGYTPMFLIHLDEALENEKFKSARENKIEFAYDYGNLNSSFELSETVISESENQSENDCHVVEKECGKVENSKVIAHGLFKLSVSQSVLPISMSKTSCDTNNVENLDTFSSVKRPKQSSVIWKKKCSSNTSNVDLSSFLKTVRFGNNDFAMIAGYGDVVIGSMTIKKASSSQSWLWHQRLSHLNFATINNLVKNNLVQGLPKMKFEKDYLCSTCEQEKIHRKHHKSKMAFASNKP